MGVVHPYSSGIGGGLFLVYYDRASKTVFTVDGREVAPSASRRDMFLKNDSNGQPISSFFGYHSVAVPGELAGMWALHQRFGRLPWRDLFEPSIRLAEQGVTVTYFYGKILAFNQRHFVSRFGAADLREILIDRRTGLTFVEGDVIRMPVLAETLKIIAQDPFGVKEFYNGSIAKNLVKDVQKGGGILQINDLEQYEIRLAEAISIPLRNNLTVYGLGPPSGNVILLHALQIVEGYGYNVSWEKKTDGDQNLFYHRLVEAMKFSFAPRLADPLFVLSVLDIVKHLLNESASECSRMRINDSQTFDDPAYYGGQEATGNEGGTGHASVLDKEGNAASLSTSINTIFGSKRYSMSTGILLNNHMDDFTTDPGKPNQFGVSPSQANVIEPKKRPQSSQSPVIIVDGDGYIVMVAGDSGGTRILSGLLNILARILFFKQDLKSALDAPRLHHQLYPPEIEYEARFPQNSMDALMQKGHKMVRSKAPQKHPYSAVEVVYVNKTDHLIYAVSDGRKGGLPDGD